MSHWEFPNEVSSGYEDIAVGSSAKSLNPPDKPDGSGKPRLAFVQCQKATARVRLDGGTVTANNGFMLAPGDGMVLEYDRVTQARFIADTNTPVVLSVHYFG